MAKDEDGNRSLIHQVLEYELADFDPSPNIGTGLVLALISRTASQLYRRPYFLTAEQAEQAETLGRHLLELAAKVTPGQHH